MQTDISLSQYLAIQEKGVAAWEFEPELEIANCFVEARTEIEFFDSECTVMSNLPVPKQNEVYYWEAKIYDKPENTLLSIGMATKPYPLFRLPGKFFFHRRLLSSRLSKYKLLTLVCFLCAGFHKFSAAYLSTGTRRYNQPFTSTPYGLPFVQGDVIGVGYRPRTGSIFFTRNGKRLEDITHGLKAQNFFPAVGANGPAIVHVNFGQAGFVFIEANVKKWGLAPMNGSLAPPPPYGSEQGSILLETGSKDGFTSAAAPPRGHGYSQSVQTYSTTRSNAFDPGHGRSRSGNFRVLPPTSPGPARSPTDISLAQLVPTDDAGEGSSSAAAANGESTIGLGLQDQDLTPPPQYSSPPQSDSGSRRNSTDSEDTPLIRGGRNRGASAVTPVRSNNPAGRMPRHSIGGPPIPSYNDAVRQGAGRDRSNSAMSRR